MKKKYLFLLLASTIISSNVMAKDLLLPDPTERDMVQNEDIIIDFSIIEELKNTPTTIKVNGRELLLPDPKVKKQEFSFKPKKAKKKVTKKSKPVTKKVEAKKDIIKVKPKSEVKVKVNNTVEENVAKSVNKTIVNDIKPITDDIKIVDVEPDDEVVVETKPKKVEAIKPVENPKAIVKQKPVTSSKPVNLLKKKEEVKPQAEELTEEENITPVLFIGETTELSTKIKNTINSTIKDIEPSDKVKIMITAYNKNINDSDVFKNRRLCFDRVIAIRHYLNEFGFENFKVKVINTDNLEKSTGLVELKLEIKE